MKGDYGRWMPIKNAYLIAVFLLAVHLTRRRRSPVFAWGRDSSMPVLHGAIEVSSPEKGVWGTVQCQSRASIGFWPAWWLMFP